MIKTPQEIEKMRRSGAVVREVLEHVRALVKPGVTTLDLENAAEKKMAEFGATSAFKGYRGYPCVLVHLGERAGSPRHSFQGAGAARRGHRFDRHRRGVGRLLRRFGHHGSGRSRGDAESQAPVGCDPEIARDGHQGSAAGSDAWATSAQRCRKWWKRTASV